MCGDIESIRVAATMKVEADEVCDECPLAASCHYLAQRKQDADIWLVAHPMLFQEDPKPIKKRGVAALVVDESPWMPGLIGADGKGVLVHLDSLDPGVLPKPQGIDGERLEDIRQRLKRALIGQPLGPVKRSALKAVGFDSETGSAAGKAEWRRKAKGGHWRERVENKSLGGMLMLWNGVSDLMSRTDNEASGWISLIRTEEGALALRLAGRKGIGVAWRIPTLLIDASLDEDLLRPYWPAVEVTGRIAVETPHQRIAQIAHPFSKDMLAPRENSDPAKEARRAKNRLKVSTFIHKLDRLGGNTLVISNKATLEALKLPSFIKTAHFNAVAGKDVWGDVDRVIVVGRTQPPPATVQRMAEALTGRPCMPLEGWYPQQDVWRLQAVPGGVQRVLSEGVRHPDPIAERMRNRICEAEVMQSIGRGRGVNRTADRPLAVIVLSDAVLPVPVDRFVSLDEALRTNARDEMLAIGGVAYEDPTAAYTAYPQLWPSIEAAKKVLQRENTGTFWNEDTFTPKCPRDRVVEVIYQRVGAKRQKGRALVDRLLTPDPRAAIEAALGELIFS
jgi:putative DNA primase/helicase